MRDNKPFSCFSSSKRGHKLKKAGAQLKNAIPGQDKDTVTTAQRVRACLVNLSSQ